METSKRNNVDYYNIIRKKFKMRKLEIVGDKVRNDQVLKNCGFLKVVK